MVDFSDLGPKLRLLEDEDLFLVFMLTSDPLPPSQNSTHSTCLKRLVYGWNMQKEFIVLYRYLSNDG